jgi:hypothetical protein
LEGGEEIACTLDVRRAERQSESAAVKRDRSGSVGEKADEADESRMVAARFVFFSQASAASNSRC